MNVVPFFGIHIQLGHCHRVCRIPVPISTYELALHQLPLKNFVVAMGGDELKNWFCPGSNLARSALTHFSGVLEEVCFVHIGPQREILAMFVKEDCIFPNLKILKLGESYHRCDPTCVTDGLRTLVARAPKLRELHTHGPVKFMLNVLEGRSTVLVVQCDVSFDEIPDIALDKVRLENIRLLYGGPNFDIQRFNRVTPRLLQAFSATIHSIHVDAFLAVALMGFNGIHLDNVKRLRMDINHRLLNRFEPSVLRILKHFNFARMFPNLDKVVTFSYFPMVELDHMLVERASAALQEPEPDRAINIKQLDLHGSISVAGAEFYAEMFPDIERIRVEEEGRKISFGSIWKNWVNLKEVSIAVDVQNYAEGLDSAFCGIFPEEVAELKQKDEESLKKVNIVPVMPAITCLRNLRKLLLFLVPFSHQPFDFDEQEDLQLALTMIFSKVTELVVFAKFPDVAVTVSTYVPRVF